MVCKVEHVTLKKGRKTIVFHVTWQRCLITQQFGMITQQFGLITQQ